MQLPASATAIDTDLSCVCDLHHSSPQHRIFNPLSRAWDRTHIFTGTSRVVTAEPPLGLRDVESYPQEILSKYRTAPLLTSECLLCSRGNVSLWACKKKKGKKRIRKLIIRGSKGFSATTGPQNSSRGSEEALISRSKVMLLCRRG